MSRDAMAELDLARDPTLRVELPQDERRPEKSRALSVAELRRFLDVFERDHVNHYALVATLAFTGLRFCHASALRWSDWSDVEAALNVERKHVRGSVGPISRRKNAPSRYPVLPPLAAVLREHRSRLKAEGHDTEGGWMFPSRAGTLRTPNSLDKAWSKALDAAGIARRFTVHGLRYTFTDLIRHANVDAVVRRAMTGHVTAEMQHHYSHIDLDEMRAAMRGVFALLDK
jgi:integrase/recombinase XerD